MSGLVGEGFEGETCSAVANLRGTRDCAWKDQGWWMSMCMGMVMRSYMRRRGGES
jgi:hypothetical protein